MCGHAPQAPASHAPFAKEVLVTFVGLGLVAIVAGLAIFFSKRHAEAPSSATTLNMSGK